MFRQHDVSYEILRRFSYLRSSFMERWMSYLSFHQNDLFNSTQGGREGFNFAHATTRCHNSWRKLDGGSPLGLSPAATQHDGGSRLGSIHMLPHSMKVVPALGAIHMLPHSMTVVPTLVAHHKLPHSLTLVVIDYHPYGHRPSGYRVTDDALSTSSY